MQTESVMTNGRAAAALVSAALGCFAIGVFTTLAEASPGFKSLITLYNPAGPLSGKTTLGVAAWFVAWVALYLVWKDREIRWGGVIAAISVLLVAGLVLTFPPVYEAFAA